MHEIARPGNLAFPISLATKLRLYYVYILPDTWSVTEASRQRLDAFDQWRLHRLRIPYTAHVTNVSVRSQTDQPPVSSLIQQRRLKLFGHITRAAASEDHSRACATSIHWLPPCWLASPKRPTSSVLASNNRQRSQTTQPWTSLCITASNGSSFLAAHRGNGYALRACHLMMMMMMMMMIHYTDTRPAFGARSINEVVNNFHSAFDFCRYAFVRRVLSGLRSIREIP